jgi:hypothetical protein
LGILLYELAALHHPFKNNNGEIDVEAIKTKKIPSLNENYTEQFKNLVYTLLEKVNDFFYSINIILCFIGPI